MVDRKKTIDSNKRLPIVTGLNLNPAHAVNIKTNKLNVYDLNTSRETGPTNSPFQRTTLCNTLTTNRDELQIWQNQSLDLQGIKTNQTTIQTDRNQISLIGALNKHKYPVDKSFDYIKPSSYHAVPELQRLVPINRKLLADVAAEKADYNASFYKDAMDRKRYQLEEDDQNDFQTTFLTGSGGVRINHKLTVEPNYSVFDRQEKPKVLKHINDQKRWASRDAKSIVTSMSPTMKQHRALVSLENFNRNHQPKNSFGKSSPKIGNIVPLMKNVNVELYSTPTISLNGRFLKSVGECSIKLTQADVQLIKPAAGGLGFDKFKQVRYVQRDNYNAQNFTFGGKRAQQRLLKFKQNPLYLEYKEKYLNGEEQQHQETESLIESEFDSDSMLDMIPQKGSQNSALKKKKKDQDKSSYQLFVKNGRKNFEEQIEKNIAIRLPEFNIVQVNDEFYNSNEDINIRNLRLQRSVINQEKYGVNMAFDEGKKDCYGFENFTLAQIDAAHKVYAKNRDKYLRTYKMLQNFWDLQNTVEHKKKHEADIAAKRRDSHVIKIFQEQALISGDTHLGKALNDPLFVALLKLRDTYDSKLKEEYKQPIDQLKNSYQDKNLTDDHTTMIIMKQLLQELGQAIKSAAPVINDENEEQVQKKKNPFEKVDTEINQNNLKTYIKQVGQNLIDKVQKTMLGQEPIVENKDIVHIGAKDYRKLTSLIKTTEFQEAMKNVVTQFQGSPEDIHVSSKKISQEQFFQIAKESVSGASAQEHFVFKIVQNSEKKNVPAMPLYTKINQGVVSLIGYRIVPGQALALATFLQEKSIDQIIKSLTLDNNSIREEEFSQILKGIAAQEPDKLKQEYLRVLVYSKNEFGMDSCESLSKICNRPYPLNLKTLVLSGLKFKQPGILANICRNLIPADQLLKLVLKDMAFDSVAVHNLCQNLASGFALQDLQLVNCGFTPQNLVSIMKTLLTGPSLATLTNFSLKQNSLRKHTTNKEFLTDLIKFVQECLNLVHLDLAGMNLTLDAASKLLQEGVYASHKIACVHIGYMGGDLPLITKAQQQENLFNTQVNVLNKQKTQKLDTVKDPSDQENVEDVQQKGEDYEELFFKNLQVVQNDNLILKNLKGLLMCVNPKNISLVDAEANEQNQVTCDESKTDARVQEKTNSVIYRLSNQPEIYQRDQVEDLFKDSVWEKIDSAHCWICNGYHTLIKQLKSCGINDKNIIKLIKE